MRKEEIMPPEDNSEAPLDTRNLPATLFIYAPEGTTTQRACSGKYVLRWFIEGQGAWQHSERTDLFLRRIPGDFWCVGDQHGLEDPLLCSWPGSFEKPDDIEAFGSWNRIDDNNERTITAVTLSRHEGRIAEARKQYEARSKTIQAILTINVTEGTEDQIGCSGEYYAVTFQGPEGRPVWRHAQLPLWLYNGNDGRWYIGNEEEFELAFRCAQGFIRSKTDVVEAPWYDHTATDPCDQWERYDDDLDEWVSTTIMVWPRKRVTFEKDREQLTAATGKPPREIIA